MTASPGRRVCEEQEDGGGDPDLSRGGENPIKQRPCATHHPSGSGPTGGLPPAPRTCLPRSSGSVGGNRRNFSGREQRVSSLAAEYTVSCQRAVTVRKISCIYVSSSTNPRASPSATYCSPPLACADLSQATPSSIHHKRAVIRSTVPFNRT